MRALATITRCARTTPTIAMAPLYTSSSLSSSCVSMSRYCLPSLSTTVASSATASSRPASWLLSCRSLSTWPPPSTPAPADDTNNAVIEATQVTPSPSTVPIVTPSDMSNTNNYDTATYDNDNYDDDTAASGESGMEWRPARYRDVKNDNRVKLIMVQCQRGTNNPVLINDKVTAVFGSAPPPPYPTPSRQYRIFHERIFGIGQRHSAGPTGTSPPSSLSSQSSPSPSLSRDEWPPADWVREFSSGVMQPALFKNVSPVMIRCHDPSTPPVTEEPSTKSPSLSAANPIVKTAAGRQYVSIRYSKAFGNSTAAGPNGKDYIVLLDNITCIGDQLSYDTAKASTTPTWSSSAMPVSTRTAIAKNRYGPRAMAKWYDSDEQQLRTLHHSGMAIEHIATQLQRSPAAIRARLQKMGIAPAPPPVAASSSSPITH